MRSHYDVVVIGTGFGGAITGMRLAQAGLSVCLLERGKRWTRDEFPRSLSQVKDGLWRDGKSYGFIEYKAFRRMDVIQGSGVGGGSLHYFNVHLRTPAGIFERPEWPAAIRRAVLDPYYELAEDMMGSQTLVPPPGFRMPPKTGAFQAAARAAGRTPELVPIAVHTGPRRLHPHSGVEQAPCSFSGDCLIGCQIQAKNTLDTNYLALAEQRYGAEVHPLCEASHIAPDEGGYAVAFRRHDPALPGRSERRSVIGKRVIVAAGTLGSNQILLRSRDVTGTLPALSPMLGRRFSGNGDMLFAATMGAKASIEPSLGPPITAGADFSRPGSKHSVYIEDLGFPNALMWLLDGMLPTTRRMWSILKANASYVKAALGERRAAFEADALFDGGRAQHMMPYLGMGTDAADGVLRLDARGAVDLDWDPRGSMDMFRDMEQGMMELSRAAGGRYVQSVLWAWPWRRLLTAHPLGGCVMGDSPARGVVNDRGEVYGYPGLYVADGAIVPGALAVNPSLTISALAERVAHHIIHGREIGAKAPENR